MRSGDGGLGRWAFVMLALTLVALGLAPGIRADDSEFAAPNVDTGLSLSSLAQLEREMGNGGGADEPTSGVLAGWDAERGFFIMDSTKAYLLEIGGRLQARYTYEGRSPRGSDEGEGLDRSYFELERARFWLKGNVLDPNLTYYFSIDADTDNEGGARLLDAYILYKAGEVFGGDKDLISFGIGQWKPYFLRQEATSAGKLQMVERSLTNEFFSTDRQLGIWTQGDLQPFFYSFAVTNGFDSWNVAPDDVDQIPAFLGKLDWNILHYEGSKYAESNVRCDDNVTWNIGLSGAYDQNNGTRETGGSQQFTCYTFGIDSVFKYSIFSVQAEYVGRWVDFPAGNAIPGMNGDGSGNYAHGFYVQGGLFLIPGTLEVTGRVSTIFGEGSGRDGNGVEVGPGLNWYISKSHRIKLQTDLMYFDISDDLPVQTENLDMAGTDPDWDAFHSSAAGYVAGEQGLMWRLQLQLEF